VYISDTERLGLLTLPLKEKRVRKKLILLALSVAALAAAYPSASAAKPNLCAGLGSSCRCNGSGILCCSQGCLCNDPQAVWGVCVDVE
jgi:hypothetical protein